MTYTPARMDIIPGRGGCVKDGKILFKFSGMDVLSNVSKGLSWLSIQLAALLLTNFIARDLSESIMAGFPSTVSSLRASGAWVSF